MRAQEGDGRLQHLQPGVAVGHMVILMFEGHELDVAIVFLERIVEELALLEGHDAVIAPMDELYGCPARAVH